MLSSTVTPSSSPETSCPIFWSVNRSLEMQQNHEYLISKQLNQQYLLAWCQYETSFSSGSLPSFPWIPIQMSPISLFFSLNSTAVVAVTAKRANAKILKNIVSYGESVLSLTVTQKYGPYIYPDDR